jgi:hypothetical protein
MGIKWFDVDFMQSCCSEVKVHLNLLFVERYIWMVKGYNVLFDWQLDLAGQ